MSINWSDYGLEELRAHATHTFRQGGGTRPDVLLINVDGNQAVLKDQNSADKWFAILIGPLLNWRECKALHLLSEHPAIPNLLAKPDGRSFLMDFHASEQVTQLNNISVNWPIFFTRLQDSIKKMHQLGVAHNDLRNPTNILVSKEGEPVLVDLVACFCRGRRWNLINNWVFTKFTQVDQSAIHKLKNRVAPELITDADIDTKDIAGRPGLWIKRVGQAIRKVSRALFTKK